MRKDQAIMQRAEWLRYCLDIGYPKEALPGLEEIWDTFKDENGNLEPSSPTVKESDLVTFLQERIRRAYCAIEMKTEDQNYPFDGRGEMELKGMHRAYSDVLTTIQSKESETGEQEEIMKALEEARCLDPESPNWSYHAASRIALEAIKKTRKPLDR